MYLVQEHKLDEKWAPVIDHPDCEQIADPYKRDVLTRLLENTTREMAKAADEGFLTEAPANVSGAFPAAANLKGYDPILIGLLRRAAPNLMAFDLAGVQPMSGPTGLIFALRAKYSTQDGTEALFDEADTTHSGKGTQSGTDPLPQGAATTYRAGTGMTTAEAEALGDGAGTVFEEMAFSIDKVTVTARSRQLRADYTIELQQDLKAVHGLDAETELANILSQEILFEINRELIRTIYNNAKPGAQHNVTKTGVFDCDTDSNGRWLVEKIKGLMFQIERDANAIAVQTRRGRGNFILCGSDVASALSVAGLLDSSPALKDNLTVDATGNTFAGVLNGRFKVYVDPYVPVSATNYFVVGYKGASAMDAGIYYCPYVPLQMLRATAEDSFQPRIAYKTRYGLVSNPFASTVADPSDWASSHSSNCYYRKVQVNNLM